MKQHTLENHSPLREISVTEVTEVSGGRSFWKAIKNINDIIHDAFDSTVVVLDTVYTGSVVVCMVAGAFFVNSDH